MQRSIPTPSTSSPMLWIFGPESCGSESQKELCALYDRYNILTRYDDHITLYNSGPESHPSPGPFVGLSTTRLKTSSDITQECASWWVLSSQELQKTFVFFESRHPRNTYREFPGEKITDSSKKT